MVGVLDLPNDEPKLIGERDALLIRGTELVSIFASTSFRVNDLGFAVVPTPVITSFVIWLEPNLLSIDASCFIIMGSGLNMRFSYIGYVFFNPKISASNSAAFSNLPLRVNGPTHL